MNTPDLWMIWFPLGLIVVGYVVFENGNPWKGARMMARPGKATFSKETIEELILTDMTSSMPEAMLAENLEVKHRTSQLKLLVIARHKIALRRWNLQRSHDVTPLTELPAFNDPEVRDKLKLCLEEVQAYELELRHRRNFTLSVAALIVAGLVGVASSTIGAIGIWQHSGIERNIGNMERVK